MNLSIWVGPRALILALSLALGAQTAFGQGVVIHELMAENACTLADGPDEYDDWIELYNPTGLPIDVGGLFLTDDPEDPTLWQIPTGRPLDTVIGPGRFLLIWADQGPPTPGLHAGFKLDGAGESVSLYDRDGATRIDSVVFPRQRADISYGRDPHDTNQWRYLVVPTPGGPNLAAFTGEVGDLRVSHGRGFYDAPFSLELSTDTAGATIVYTVDGGVPCDAFGVRSAGARVYTGPISVGTTTCVRAAGCRSGWLSTPVETHTYIFPEAVRNQATNPATGVQVVPPGYPAKWGSANADYQVDPDVVGDKDQFGGLYRQTFVQDLKTGPTVSLVMARDDWFGPTGIYINESQDGTERACSLEWIDPNGIQGFQINCAMAMQGGAKHDGGGTSLQRWKTFKLSMRPRFKTTADVDRAGTRVSTDGPSRLDYPVFPDSPVKSLDTFVLDEVLSNAWNHAGQHMYSSYFQDQYVSDLHNAMGGHSPHGLYAHVYINGLYWGMYYVHERPDDSWAAEMFGGEKEEYDCIKHSTARVVNNGNGISGGAVANFNAMLSAANAVAADPTNAAKYETLCRQLDVDNFITDLLAHWFALNWDWPEKNWYATHRNTPDGKWRFHVWDAEHSLEWLETRPEYQDVYGLSVSGIHDKLKVNAEYRMRFADLVHRFFFNGGALTYSSTSALHAFRMAQMDRMIVGESARWGDTRQAVPHTRQDWVDYQSGVLSNWIKPHSEYKVLDYLKGAGLYPSLGAPIFNVNGSYRHGGQVASTDTFSMAAPAGTLGKIYYTLDGSDPRLPYTGDPSGLTAITLAPASASKRVLVPAAAVSDAWRGGGAFGDSAWALVTGGPGGVGFDANPASGGDYTAYMSYDVGPAMNGKNTTCYIRIPFTVSASDLSGLAALTLKVQYDDGFVAYLNGTEVSRAGLTGTPVWNSQASASHAAGTTMTSLDISGHVGLVRAGQNVLAIQGLNNSLTSTDLLILAELAGGKTSGGPEVGVSGGAVEYKGPIRLARSVLVKARVRSSGEWSALNEAVYAVGPVAESLRVTEIMYHPQDTGDPADANAEYIELANVGSEAINLNLVRFTEGIGFTFGDMSLQPGQYVLVVKDLGVFTARYGEGLPIAGVYEGSLSNGGEEVRLEDAIGQVILDFEYKDGWYKSTDGRGHSLVVREPGSVDPGLLGDKDSWLASPEPGGTPGRGE
ncbi:MAG: lamin tail domain-containing protein [Phycisphaerae bacterium]|nr:lamin tail domain-containing protein [Phycisphaerae bacterium]